MRSEEYKYTILTNIEWTTMPKPLQEPIMLTATAFSNAESWWRHQSQRFIQWCKLHKHRTPRKCKYPEVPKKSRRPKHRIKVGCSKSKDGLTLLIRNEEAISPPVWHEGHKDHVLKCIMTPKYRIYWRSYSILHILHIEVTGSDDER